MMISKAGMEAVLEEMRRDPQTIHLATDAPGRLVKEFKSLNSGQTITKKDIPREELEQFAEYIIAQKFFDYYEAVFAEGELTEREKSLIALAVAHAVQCPYCIDAYTNACLEKGSNLAEMTEALHVVTAIRGGASLVHGVQMRNIGKKISM